MDNTYYRPGQIINNLPHIVNNEHIRDHQPASGATPACARDPDPPVGQPTALHYNLLRGRVRDGQAGSELSRAARPAPPRALLDPDSQHRVPGADDRDRPQRPVPQVDGPGLKYPIRKLGVIYDFCIRAQSDRDYGIAYVEYSSVNTFAVSQAEVKVPSGLLK